MSSLLHALLQQWLAIGVASWPKLLNLAAWLPAFALIFGLLERARPLRKAALLRPGLGQDVAYYFLGSTASVFVTAAASLLLVLFLRSLLPLPLQLGLANLPVEAQILLALLIGDFCYYWAHRWQHALRWVWHLHATHHSPKHMDWLVNTRAHPVDLAFSSVVGFVPAFVLGISNPTQGLDHSLAAALGLFSTAQAFFVHANVRVRLGWIERVFVTPAFHHWHHANEGAASNNKNFGGIFPWWDRLFGTLYLPPDRFPLAYGIPEQTPASLLGQLFWPSLKPAETPSALRPTPSAITPSPARGPL